MKRFILWSTGILLALIVAVVLAFWLSPWPSVAVITYMFSTGEQASEGALEKHVPAGILTRRDIAYGDGRDEIFDLYHVEKATGPQPSPMRGRSPSWRTTTTASSGGASEPS